MTPGPDPGVNSGDQLEAHLEEIEDIYIAEKRLIDLRAGRSRSYTLDEVERELGLAD